MELEWVEVNGVVGLKVRRGPETHPDQLGVHPAELVGPGSRRSAALPSTAGAWSEGPDAVVFVPRFPFVPGRSYTVLCGAGDDVTSATIELAGETGAPTTTVTSIHPSSPTVPRNLLRIYVRFSDAMSDGSAARQISIERADSGEVLPLVLLDLDAELWDPDRRRLTVLLDPGRIKRGLAPHRQVGYPLQEGVPVRVTVGAGFVDAAGRPLVSSAARVYTVGPDLRTRVDPGRWQLHVPESGTRDPLRIGFDRPLDHALLEHCLRLGRHGHGDVLAGLGSVGDGEVSWSFTPKDPWMAGVHLLAVDGILEDQAGNSVVRVFDRDLERPEDAPLSADRVTLEVSIV